VGLGAPLVVAYILHFVFKDEIDLTDPRYTERENLDYAVMKTHRALVEIEANPTTQDEYQKSLEKSQYYFGLLNEKYPWKG
jgi:hypothetical protein